MERRNKRTALGVISKLPRWVWIGSGLLAFSAGTVNAIAFLGFVHNAATHVTGTFSLFSIALFRRDFPQITQTFLLVFFFFVGAFLSGIIIHDGQLKMGKRYGVALLVECSLLLLSAYGFVHTSIWGEYFASMAAGLQNSMASTYSGAIVRTTHLTGILSDLGALTGSRIRGYHNDFDRKKARLLSIITFSFVAGGFLGAFSYERMGAYAMLLPAAVIGASAVSYEIMRRRKS
jgi:uncharacterized membrane protein YoaK (UPF0700 family)